MVKEMWGILEREREREREGGGKEKKVSDGRREMEIRAGRR